MKKLLIQNSPIAFSRELAEAHRINVVMDVGFSWITHNYYDQGEYGASINDLPVYLFS